jgi:alkanesulfonate monooxygenase
MREDVARLRALATQNGRAPRDILVFALATVVTAATDEEAEARFAEYQGYVSEAGTLAMMSGWAGVDLSKPREAQASAAASNAIQSVAAAIAGPSAPAGRRVGRPVGLGGGGPAIVGGPGCVADELQAWAEEADIDGFNLAYVVMPETFADIVEHLIPELQRRGAYKTHYAPGTYREKLFGAGPRLGSRHPAAAYRAD